MSYLTVNGAEAVSLSLKMPRLGVWHADVAVSESQGVELDGAIEIGVAGMVWRGTARRAGSHSGIARARAVGGAGGFSKSVPAKAYQGVPLRIPVSDLLAEVGERLSPKADAGVLGTFLPKWVRMQQGAGTALASMLGAAGSPPWRVLADGTVWTGPEAWPDTQLEDFTVTSETPDTGSVDLAAVTPNLFPGELLMGRRVTLVELSVTQQIHLHAWTEGSDE